jgi:hypothetical protein
MTRRGAKTDSVVAVSLDINGWGLSPRGAGFLFGADITKVFAHHNAIDLIARAHQLAMEGYKLMFDSTIVTVWSAPNYCYRYVCHRIMDSSLILSIGVGMLHLYWSWTSILDKNTKSSPMHRQYES